MRRRSPKPMRRHRRSPRRNRGWRTTQGDVSDVVLGGGTSTSGSRGPGHRPFRPIPSFLALMPYSWPILSPSRRSTVGEPPNERVFSWRTDKGRQRGRARPGDRDVGRRGIDRRNVRGLLTVRAEAPVGSVFDPALSWRLPHLRVSVRPEPFGALLYHFGTRKLSLPEEPHDPGSGRAAGGTL